MIAWVLVQAGKLAGSNPAFDLLLARNPTLRRNILRVSAQLVPLDGKTPVHRVIAHSKQNLRCTFTPIRVNGRRQALMVTAAELNPAADSGQGDAARPLPRTDRLLVAGQLALGVAHDVNNVLGAVQLHLRLQAGNARTPAQRRGLKILDELVGDASRRLKRLQSLGNWQPRELTATDLREVVDGTLELAETALRLMAAERSVRVRIVRRLSRRLPSIIVDPDDLRDALLNVLMMAQAEASSDGTIALSATARRKHVVLAIDAHGAGPAHDASDDLRLARALMLRAGGELRRSRRPAGPDRTELLFPRVPALSVS